MTVFFPIAEYWWFYAAFTGMVLLFLAIDLGVFHREVHEVGFREAAIWTGIWAALALLFCVALYFYCSGKFGPDTARQLALEFLTGYIVEESLSLDNMFVFVLVFRYFAIPRQFQHRILFFGILGALVFRAAFIALGSALLQYGWVVIVFGAFLILTGIQMMWAGNQEASLDDSFVLRTLRRIIPVDQTGAQNRFFVRTATKTCATPSLLALVFVEVSDILFAIDSVPAIFGITREPLIVFTSNVFAILGLRSIYFLLAGAIARFHLLHYGLALVLIFVGLKMTWLNHLWHGHFPTGISLGVITGLVGASIAVSLLFPKASTSE